MEGMFVDPAPSVSELVFLLPLLLTLVLTFVKICFELFVNVLMLVPVSAMLEPKKLLWIRWVPQPQVPTFYLGQTPSHPPFPQKCLFSTLRDCIKHVSYPLDIGYTIDVLFLQRPLVIL